MSDKVFITKNALTRGILEADSNDVENNEFGISIKNRFILSKYVFLTQEESIQDAEKQRQRTIRRLLKIDYSITKPIE